jgi:hypothetical protein
LLSKRVNVLCRYAPVEMFKQEQRAAVFNTIKAQRTEKFARDNTIKGIFASNTVEPEFFAQFGTSAR